VFDVYLSPCVTVKVPGITAESLPQAMTQAEAVARLDQLFVPLNQHLPAGVTWVEWSEEMSHALVDEMPPDPAEDEPVNSHFLNTAQEPVCYAHTTGCWLRLTDDHGIVRQFGPFRQVDCRDGYLRCTPWRASDLPQVFHLTEGGLAFQGQVYAQWSVVSIGIPDHVGLPIKFFDHVEARKEVSLCH
jgi:hypothetical protein